MLSRRSGQHTSVWHTNHIYDQLHLFTLVSARKERKSGEKFDHDAAKRPHINLLVVGEESKHDIGGTVEATLYVSIDDLVLEATGSEICYDDARFILLLEQDVFRLQITVDDIQMFHIAQG
jgi:hypothetical protein